MRSHRRALSTLAVFALALGLITGVAVSPASAAIVQVTINNITYTADTGAQAAGATVASYTGAGGAVTIESSVTISGVAYAVTSIGGNVFNSKKLTEVTIPGSVMTIGTYAFASNSLQTVTIPNGVTTINLGAFNGNQLSSVEISSSVTTIGNYAFADNNLQTVSIPSSVTAINTGAFFDNQLSTVGIPDSVTTIGNDAFFRNSLASVTLPSALTSIGDGAFKSNSMTTVTIPANVSTIGQNAFDTSVTNVFFLGLAPTITQAGTYGSFGFYPDKTLWYLYANRASFDAANGNVVWRQYTIAVFGTPFTTTTTPSISGTAQVGQTLTAHISRWWTWSPIPTTISYAWTRSGSAEVLGTDDTYLPTMADIGLTLVVTVTGDRLGYASAVVTSLPTNAVVAATFSNAVAPTIAGTAQVGQSLTASTGAWASGANFTYSWKRPGRSAPVGTAANYTPVAADIGKALSVTVTATQVGYTTATTPAATTAQVIGLSFTASPTPSITGTTTRGSTLTAVTGTWNPSTRVTYTYVWSRAKGVGSALKPITGATSKTYKLVAADKGKYLTVTVTASRSKYATTSKTSLRMLVSN